MQCFFKKRFLKSFHDVLIFIVALARLRDYLPSKILGDNSHHQEVQSGVEPLLVKVLWIRQISEEDVENCAMHKLMAIYIDEWKKSKKCKRLIPRDDIEALYKKLKQPRKEAQMQSRAQSHLSKK